METEIEYIKIRSPHCDWCDKKHIAKVTVHNKFWYLCMEHLLKYQERFNISDEQIKHILKIIG